jgi:alpha-beta hydrolase superfamily lysophospholipase
MNSTAKVHGNLEPATRQATGWLLGEGNLPLFYRTWQPGPAPRAAVLITHGLGDHSGRYRHIGQVLAAEKYAVYALDQRGHGRSAGPRTAGSITDSVADLSSMVAHIRREVSSKVFLLGHSWGGMLTLRYAVEHQDEIDGVILSAAAARAANVPAVRIAVGKALARIAPNAGVVNLPFDKACSDPEIVAAQRNDPLTFQGPIKARMAQQSLAAIDRIASGMKGLTIPVLLLHGTADQFNPPATSQYVYDNVGALDKNIHLYENLWHQLFNEPDREMVYNDVRTWLNARAD